uniref:Uncharacterized protein n=1 Tax=Calcidiscus leptoporus TaxID=127549 RepID=A0A7S0NWL7_9EUKA|eukprot:CAMPEP_0119367414 /NCGR_PEP_ID=MMETSP1334-20130426/14195_1 /TAXON_ID=127549 /ORGANISM="Calcidiscus leptoporus, Strain RCC1130" /LENGTH=166 /DNA_ID=CAMNT_0007383813 /DNA_START=51 /DNA_END=551 /DNA_ORIENTATION=+
MGFTVCVTTASATPLHVDRRVAAFLRKFLRSVGRMGRASFSANLAAAVANTLRDDHNLAEEVQRVAGEIASRQYVWDRAEQQAAAMRGIEQSEFCGWAKRTLLGEGRRALCVHAHEGSLTPEQAASQPVPNGAVNVPHEGAGQFRAKLQVYRQVERAMPAVQVQGQ